MVTKVLLVRHAEPFMPGETPGAEHPLIEKGRNEAIALGTCFADRPLAVIWTSPERRARETAAPMTRAHFEEWASIFQPPDEEEFLLFDTPLPEG